MQDADLLKTAEQYSSELSEEWLLIKEVLDKYPDIFTPNVITSELYFKFYGLVCTRCFGWGLPSTSLIPMADNLNHSDVDVSQEIINTDMHLTAQPGASSYFTKSKMMNDFSINF